MATTCYYQILEVTKEATPEQIKQSYKKLALVPIPLPRNITLIRTSINNKLKSTLQRSPKPIQVQVW